MTIDEERRVYVLLYSFERSIEEIEFLKRTAESKDTPVEILYDLLADKRDNIQIHLATNPNAPAGLLAKLADSEDYYVLREVARHENTPLETLIQLSEAEEWPIVYAVAMNPSLPVEKRHDVYERCIEAASESDDLDDDLSSTLVKLSESEETPLELLTMLMHKSLCYCDEDGTTCFFDCTDAVIRNPTMINFINDVVNPSLKTCNNSSIDRAVYFDDKEDEYMLRTVTRKSHLSRKVTFDVNNNVMEIYDKKDKWNVIGTFDWKKKELIDLRKGPQNKVKQKVK